MKTQNEFWNDVDLIIQRHNEHILSDEQRLFIGKEEQNAYEANIDTIKAVIEEFEKELKLRGFWTELYIEKGGFRFRFSKRGYYGPGGFSSQYHIAGPLVLGIINPTGDAIQSFYKNKLEDNLQIGSNFDKNEFVKFVEHVISDFLAPNNLIISRDQYDYLRNFNSNN